MMSLMFAAIAAITLLPPAPCDGDLYTCRSVIIETEPVTPLRQTPTVQLLDRDIGACRPDSQVDRQCEWECDRMREPGEVLMERKCTRVEKEDGTTKIRCECYFAKVSNVT